MNFQRFIWDELDGSQRSRVLSRAQQDIAQLEETVAPIIADVRERGDRALAEYALRFDGATLDHSSLFVSEAEFDAAERAIDSDLKTALDHAIENVRVFHQSQLDPFERSVQVRNGIYASERHSAIESVGLYVPSGRGSFPSMMYMLAVPAVLAGVPQLLVTTPPRRDGSVDPAVLYAARRCGIGRIVKAGGAQAVAALAHGTESIPSVRKIVGPGSAYVAAAKRLVADLVDVGLPAGPSESIIIADRSSDPVLVALDLMIEAEHGSDSSALLVCDSKDLIDAVIGEIDTRIGGVPEPRQSYLRDVFSSYGGAIQTRDRQQSAEVVNEFAPEHLLLHATDPRAMAAMITNASEVLIGPHTAFSLANYATGPNAVLPTGGWARSFGPVGVDDFRKRSTVIEVTERGFQEMAPHVVRLADHEGFFCHAAALRERMARKP